MGHLLTSLILQQTMSFNLSCTQSIMQDLARESQARTAYVPSHICDSLPDAKKRQLHHPGNLLVVLGSCSFVYHRIFQLYVCSSVQSRLGHLFWIAFPSNPVGLTASSAAVAESWSASVMWSNRSYHFAVYSVFLSLCRCWQVLIPAVAMD